MDPMAAMQDPGMMKQMEESMNNPEMRKMMTDMMKNMDPEGMKNMMKMSGMEMSDSQADMMANQMKGMSEKDLERMMSLASKAQKVGAVAVKAKDFAKKNLLVVIAIVVMLIGLFMRWMGWA